MSRLKDKVAIVTGATAGIGKGIAMRLAAEGAKVVVNARTAQSGERIVEEIHGAGGEAIFIGGDVLSTAQMIALADQTVARLGRIDVLVASAGGLLASKEARVPAGDLKGASADSRLFRNLPPTLIVEKLATATLAKLNPAHAVLRHMIERNSGCIIFVTSEGGRTPTAGQTVTSLAAGGLIMTTKVLAKEHARFRIRVNTIAVTLVEDTPSWQQYTSGLSNRAGMYDSIAKKAPFGLAKPRDIAAVAAFLASDDAAFITGATLSPTGGLTYN